MSLDGKSASCKMYVLAGSLGDILRTGEVCRAAIKANCLLSSWENPADFRTMSTALLIRGIAVNFTQEHVTYTAHYTVSRFVRPVDKNRMGLFIARTLNGFGLL